MKNKYFLFIQLAACMQASAMQEQESIPMHSEEMFTLPVPPAVHPELGPITPVPTISEIFRETQLPSESSKSATSFLNRVGIPQPENSVAGLKQLPEDFLVKKSKEEARALAEKKIAEKTAAGEFNHPNPAVARDRQQDEQYKLYAHYRLSNKTLPPRPVLPQNENRPMEHEEPRWQQSDLQNWAQKLREAIKSANHNEIKSLLSLSNKCAHGSLSVQTMSFAPVMDNNFLATYLPPALAILAEIPQEESHLVNLVGTLLIQSGAKVNDCNGKGISALSWICKNLNKPSAREAVRFLIDHGAETNVYYNTDTVSVSDNNNNIADFLSRKMLRPYPLEPGTFFDIRKKECARANTCPCPECIISSKKGEKARGIERLFNPRPMVINPSIPKDISDTPASKIQKTRADQQSASDKRAIEQARLKKPLLSERLRSSRM